MVHKRSKTKQLIAKALRIDGYYVVTAFYGSPMWGYRESYIVKGKKNVKPLIAKLKKRGYPDPQKFHVEKNGVAYLRGFTIAGAFETRKAMLTDKPNVTEVVWVKKKED